MITLDMINKTEIRITNKMYTLENDILTLEIDPQEYDITNKVITASFSLAGVETMPLSVIDGIIQLPIYSNLIKYGINYIQLFFRWDVDKLENSGKILWRIDSSIPTTEVAQEDIDIINYLVNEVTLAVDEADRVVDETGDLKIALDESVTNANNIKGPLDTSTLNANTINNTLSDVAVGTIKQATDIKVILEGKITDGTVLKGEIEDAIVANQIVTQPEFETLKIDYTTLKGLNDGVLTPEKTSFINISTNMYDDTTKSLGYNISSANGALVANASYNSSDFIEIKPSTNYSYLGFLNVAYYDINKAFISRPPLLYVGQTLLSPSNAYFIRTHFEVSTLTTYLRQINKGAVLLTYENYYKKLGSKYIDLDISVLPKETLFFDISTNLFDKQNATLGNTILSGTGIPSVNEYYSVSEYVPVKYSTAYSFIGINRVVWYDAAKNYISNITRVDYNPKTSISPATVAYVRFAVQNIELGIAQFNEGSALLEYEDGTPKLKTWVYGDIPKMDNIARIDVPIDGVFNTNETYAGFTDMYTRTASQTYALFDALMASYPNYITRTLAGNSVTGLPVYVYKLKPTVPTTDKASKMIKIFLTCGVHGIEKASTLSTYLMIKQMCEKWNEYPLLEALRFNVEFIIMPICNPWGWNNGSRINSNGVDINRNFPYQWTQGTFGTQTYGGLTPLSELESQYVKSIFDNNKDIDIMYDFHNFFKAAAEPNEQFLWIPTSAGVKVQHLAQTLISRLTRKWGKEFNFLDGKFVGFTSTVAEGMIQNYAHSLGIKYCGTFEVRDGIKLDPLGIPYDQNMCKAGTEAITNWLLLNIKDLLDSQ